MEQRVTPENGIIVVTGSNGRIGDAVMRRFAGRFESIVGFDRKAPAPPPPGCVYMPVEITSDTSVREGLANGYRRVPSTCSRQTAVAAGLRRAGTAIGTDARAWGASS
jgi:NAD(P)-dependent dehydrogenase (short-subunit alcohol dehydrogenase family)